MTIDGPMEVERWVSLFRAAEIENLDDLVFVVAEGPLIIDFESDDHTARYLLTFRNREQVKDFNSKWEEIKSVFANEEPTERNT